MRHASYTISACKCHLTAPGSAIRNVNVQLVPTNALRQQATAPVQACSSTKLAMLLQNDATDRIFTGLICIRICNIRAQSILFSIAIETTKHSLKIITS